MSSICQLIFLVPIGVVGAAALVHATGYLQSEDICRRRWFYIYFCGTIGSMIGVVLSNTMLTFLLAWEAMGLFSTGLVGFESESKATKKATWIYLLACQAGALLLILAGVMSHRVDAKELLTAIYCCAFFGFALKIGLPPFHVWLPEAHPAAPAPASAIMSGAMIPLGFCGLMKFFPVYGKAGVLPLVGWTLFAFGAMAALGGILFALPQRNLKRLLAFSSVENMGVIALGLALAVFAREYRQIAMLALGGAMLHVVNHALLKGALFLGAGSVMRATGTLDIDRMGGLMKKMPITGTLFTINALGLSGMPPMNGFVSEALIYIAAFMALAHGELVMVSAAVIIIIALTGGIACAVYAKAISAVFLGAARSDIDAVKESPKRMYLAIGALTVLSAALSGTIVFLLPVALVFCWRRRLRRGRLKPQQPTWDCGYHAPTARMAWTGSAFAQPLADTFRGVLRPRQHEKVIVEDSAPFKVREAAVATETDDLAVAGMFGPLFHWIARMFQRSHLLQNGSLHFYVLLMIIALAALLIWGVCS